jgi:TRAP-type C4-dicarboxylate transport system permease small subunit
MSPRFAERVDRVIHRFLEATLVVLLSSMAMICFVEVVLRYGLGKSFGWYDEFTGYLLVWLTFLGAVAAQQEGRHIGMGGLAERLGPRRRRLAALGTHALMIALHLTLLFYGALLAFRFVSDRAITLPVPMGIIYTVIPLSALLMLGVEVIRLGRLFRSEPDN